MSKYSRRAAKLGGRILLLSSLMSFNDEGSSSSVSAFTPSLPLTGAPGRTIPSTPPVSTHADTSPPVRAHRISYPLRAGTKHRMPTGPIYTNAPQLTPWEECQLLEHVVENRRIKSTEAELTERSSTVTPLLSVRCEAAGYGTDFDAYERALDKGQRARETLVTRNMGLVGFVVDSVLGKRGGRMRKLNSLSREDLIQEGTIGLSRAVDKYNFNQGPDGASTKFSTYAVYWIRAAVLRCIAEHDDLVRVPAHVSAAVRKVTAAAQKLGVNLNGEEFLASLSDKKGAWKEAEAAKALALEAGLSEKQLKEAIKVSRRRRTGGYTQLEPWMQPSTVSVLSQDELAVGASVSESSNTEQLKATLSRFLRPREIEALSLRYGLTMSSQANEPKDDLPQPEGFKDYLAEAEAELFGPGGLLGWDEYDEKVKQMAAEKAKETAAAKKMANPEEEPFQFARISSKAGEKASVQQRRTRQRRKKGEAMTFTEVGKAMAVSGEYGRKLVGQALDKLRRAVEDGRLKPEYLF